MSEIEQISPKELYYTIRNLIGDPYQTLSNRENVKSNAEKYIADFLFEYGIDYIYEKEFQLDCLLGVDSDLDQILSEYGKKNTKPDFFLPQYNLVWEHWGIDEFDQSFHSHPSTTWGEYRRTMEIKRELWHNANNWLIYSDWRYGLVEPIKEILSVKKLIETSITDLNNGRHEFEMSLIKLLKSNGIDIKKRNEDDLINEVWKKHNCL